MKRYILTQKNEIDGCLELQFRPLSAADRIDFTPGQYIALGFRGYRGKQTPLRSFSLTNIPQNLANSRLQ